jgi:hypothetical protein
MFRSQVLYRLNRWREEHREPQAPNIRHSRSAVCSPERWRESRGALTVTTSTSSLTSSEPTWGDACRCNRRVERAHGSEKLASLPQWDSAYLVARDDNCFQIVTDITPYMRTMHQREIHVSRHPHARRCSPTCPRFGRDVSLCPHAEAKKKGRSVIRGTQESDRIAPIAPAQVEVRAGAVLSSGGCAEPQATGAVPQQASAADRNCVNEETKKRITRPRTVRNNVLQTGVFQHL